MVSESDVSSYWRNKGVKLADRRAGKTWDRNGTLACDECCNGDRCDTPLHFDRESCPYCLGTSVGIPAPDPVQAINGE